MKRCYMELPSSEPRHLLASLGELRMNLFVVLYVDVSQNLPQGEQGKTNYSRGRTPILITGWATHRSVFQGFV